MLVDAKGQTEEFEVRFAVSGHMCVVHAFAFAVLLTNISLVPTFRCRVCHPGEDELKLTDG
jgi:hypothetical protein